MINDFVIDYLKKTKIPFVVITDELLQQVATKQPTVADIIQDDLQSSFDQGFVVYYREIITEEILILLHDFFRNTCCNIENVVLVEVQGLGLERFYRRYCRAHNTRGFNIIEIPWMYWIEKYLLDETYHVRHLPSRQNIKAMFTYYGGTYEIDPPERTLMTLFASQYKDIAQIETLFDPTEWGNLENYLEYLTYFGDSKSIKEYKNLYDLAVQNKKFNIPTILKTTPLRDERFLRQGPQWEADSVSFFSLIRETNCTQNFYCLSEKTMRCFFHGVAPIPTHGGEYVIDDLEALGFKINRSLIDYSYLNEENLFFRLQKLKDQLDKLRLISYDDWLSLWLDNYDMFNYNSEYLVSSYKNEIIIPRLDNYFI